MKEQVFQIDESLKEPSSYALLKNYEKEILILIGFHLRENY